MVKNKKINIVNIDELKVKPFKLTPKFLEDLKIDLIEKKQLLEYYKSCVIQLTSDIEEIEEIILNAGATQEMLNKWYLE